MVFGSGFYLRLKVNYKATYSIWVKWYLLCPTMCWLFGRCMLYLRHLRYNEDKKPQKVTEAYKASWGPIWHAKNAIFSYFLLSDPALAPFTNLMFFMCDGNHRCQAWLNHIDRLHQTNEDWHYLVDSILLDTKGKNGLVMQVMHNINKYVHIILKYVIFHWKFNMIFHSF